METKLKIPLNYLMQTEMEELMLGQRHLSRQGLGGTAREGYL